MFRLDYPDPKRMPKEIAEQYKEAKRTAGYLLFFNWWKDTLPLHFLPSAVQKYEYRKRTRKHDEAKRRKFGHENPIEWTGRSKSIMLRRFPNPVIQKGEMRLVFRGLPFYFYIVDSTDRVDQDGTVRPGKKQPPKRYEVVAVTRGEARSMGAQFKRDLRDTLKKLRGA